MKFERQNISMSYLYNVNSDMIFCQVKISAVKKSYQRLLNRQKSLFAVLKSFYYFYEFLVSWGHKDSLIKTAVLEPSTISHGPHQQLPWNH